MEQTHPDTGVSQELSPQARMENLLAQSPDPAPEEETQPEGSPEQELQPEGPASDELTPDDLEAEGESVEQPQTVDAFEIVHNGTQVKLTREEAIAYARQGFDYTQKTQALAEQSRRVESYLQTIAQVDEVRPHLHQQEGVVRALEVQLSQYQNVDWIRLANEDPIAYSQQRAHFDVLRDNYGRARQEYERQESYVKQELAKVQQARLAEEIQRLPTLIPEWKDPAKRSAAESEIVKHYANTYGVPEQELRANLKGAISLAVVYKAMRYDQLQKSKAEKVKQLRTAPPVTVPGAKSGSAKADKDVALRQNLRKTGSAQDAMAVLLNRMK